MDIRFHHAVDSSVPVASRAEAKFRPLIRRGLLLALGGLVAFALSSALAAASLADTPESIPATKRPVSTSPLASERSDLRKSRSASRHAPPNPPLTRAAARKQIEAISPADWLARFGKVEVAHRE